MPRNLGYPNVFENCYFSTYGRDQAKLYNERFYCDKGKRYEVHNCKEVQPGMVCPDWPKCRNLHEAAEKLLKGKRMRHKIS